MPACMRLFTEFTTTKLGPMAANHQVNKRRFKKNETGVPGGRMLATHRHMSSLGMQEERDTAQGADQTTRPPQDCVASL